MLDGNSTSIIIALLAILATMSGAIIWFGKWAVKNYGNDIKEHTNAANNLAQASQKMARSVDKNTQSNEEVLKFMKNLNGKLEGAVVDKALARANNKEHGN